MDAFDADVLIYAAAKDHPLGRKVSALFPTAALADDAASIGVGSLLLLPEVLSKPLREGAHSEARALASLLARLDLRPFDQATAELAVALSVAHRLKAADAAHLATAVAMGADRFLTNNRRDFSSGISEVDIVFPEDLPDPP